MPASARKCPCTPASGSKRKPRLLHQYFEREARRRPNHNAVEFSGESVTYAQLERSANRIANHLIKRGMRPGDLVGIYLKKSPRLYAVMLGILKAGGGYVPIDPKFPLDRIKAIADDASLRFVVSESTLADTLASGTQIPLLRIDSEAKAIQRGKAELGAEVRRSFPETTLSYVIYTSGSTGRPKGVMIEHRNAVAFVATLRSIYRVSQHDRVYQGFSTAFDASIEEIWAAFSRGGTLVVPTEDVERSPSDVASFIDAHRITYYSTVPTMLSMIDRELPTVRTLVLGGEACSNELVTRWANSSRRMLNTYGPTEATVVATWAECVAGQPVTIGHALPGYEAYVLDELQQPVAPGEVGELYVGGAGVGRGYMNLPALTSDRFIPNAFNPASGARLYRTSDQVRLGASGELHFLGRLDDQIKIRGFRIELSEIESVLLEHPMIKAAAVGVIEVSQMKELAAYVVCNRGTDTIDRTSLAEMLRCRVPPYMVPKYLDIVSDLPVMPSGKVDRKNLPAPQSLLKGMGNIVAPADDLEQAIARAWKQAFKLPEVSVESDFFVDLGGHSLLAAQCVNMIRAARGSATISVRDIYESRTIRGLAKAMRDRGDIGLDIAKEDAGSDRPPTAAQTAFASVSPAVRWTTVAIQAMVAILYYGIIAAPLTYAVLMFGAVQGNSIELERAVAISTAIGFATWPALVLFSIVLKWVVIGRYKAGRYPLWSGYYLRWWIVSRFQGFSWSEMFCGTPLLAWYWRAMGARIGRNVTICTPLCSAFDVVSIGDHSSIGLETQILGYRVEDGHLIIAPVDVGQRCFVGMHCNLGLNTRMMNDARLDDMSLLPDNGLVPAHEGWRGSPARRSDVNVPETTGEPAGRVRVAAFAVIHLALIYVMGYFLIAVSVPGFALIAVSLLQYGPWAAAAAAFAAVPLSIATYVLAAVLLKKLLGREKPGKVPVFSARYLKHWFTAYLLANTKNILMPVYATVFLPGLLRALGAKIGKGSEISTVSHVSPDLLEVGDGSFLADACIVGGQRINRGTLEVAPVRIGARSFVGNSALVSGGHSIGENSLIGVASTPPAGMLNVPGNSRWLGSPGFALPRTQNEGDFNDAQIFHPSRAAVIERTLTDGVRIVLPGFILAASSVVFAFAIDALSKSYGLWPAIAAVPFVATVLALAAVLAAAAVKRLFSGTLGPVVQPLWSRFVWHNELVNGVYENVAAPAMSPLMGTPFLAPCLRAMGCKIGKWCFLETTLFSEFDLVTIGDRASLNLGATVQTHLFEDRVFKADHLTVGDDCSIGNMAVTLYGSEMKSGSKLGPLSVLMKGETLPSQTSWHGIPCDPVQPAAALMPLGEGPPAAIAAPEATNDNAATSDCSVAA